MIRKIRIKRTSAVGCLMHAAFWFSAVIGLGWWEAKTVLCLVSQWMDIPQ